MKQFLYFSCVILFISILSQDLFAQGTFVQLGGSGNSYEISVWQQLLKQSDKHWLNIRLGVNDWVKPMGENEKPSWINNVSFSLGYGYQMNEIFMPYLTIRKDLYQLKNIGIVTGLDIQTKTRFLFTVGFTSTYDITQDWNRSNGWLNIYYQFKKIKLNLGGEISMDVNGEIGFLWLISKSI